MNGLCSIERSLYNEALSPKMEKITHIRKKHKELSSRVCFHDCSNHFFMICCRNEQWKCKFTRFQRADENTQKLRTSKNVIVYNLSKYYIICPICEKVKFKKYRLSSKVYYFLKKIKITQVISQSGLVIHCFIVYII